MPWNGRWMSEADGVVVIDKREGLTSFDVVARLRRVFGTRRIGHTGTLDPMATGALPICVGPATRLVPFLIDGDKGYDAQVTLGTATDTLDRTGRVVATGAWEGLTRGDVERVLDAFRGEIFQTPPMFSAIRIDGQRLHTLARKGIDVEREARPVTIHALTLTLFEPPVVELSVRCSKGTFVRTLADDLGAALGCRAHLSALRRTHTAGFGLERAHRLEELEALQCEEARARLMTAGEALCFLRRVTIDEGLARRVRFGQRLGAAELPMLPERERFCLFAGEEPVAVAEIAEGRTRYLRVFPASAL